MDFTMNVPTTVNVTKLYCVMGVRYWEDATVNGKPEDEDGPKMPFAVGDTWAINIDLETGKIDNWPGGVTARTHYKVCDAGAYSLIREDGRVAASRDGYVPSMLAPNGGGYGDYVILDIGPDGTIASFRADLSYFEGDYE